MPKPLTPIYRILSLTADGFDSHSEFSNTDSLLKPNSVKMKDEINISEKLNFVKMKDTSEKLNVGASETHDNTQSADESIKGKSLNILENLVGSKDDGSVRCSLKIELFDDTAMIDISQVGKSYSVDNKFRGFDGKSGRNRKKNNATHQQNGQKMVAKEKNVVISEKRIYCRKELENLRFIGMEEQRKMWVEVYCGLGDTVQKEYDALLHSKHIPRRHLGKENTPLISGNDHSEHLDDQEGSIDTRNSPSVFPLSRDAGISYEGESNVYEESDDSDDDYSSIQRHCL
ncbi:hypothetical protein RND71_022360 [Anisodus tanguticus]|uniref:Uncharacterized protein n=1 Tax=Anisodus tanguticus TaxID=243964 RepID=A0AAE1RQV5_9SOLA|nr:hypothetical protein RND71_022360 [Anisodus tanguticus]